MQSLLVNYLFQNGNCTLPSLGHLQICNESASSNFTEKQLAAPTPFIKLNKETPDATDLIHYLSAKTNTSLLDAENNLFIYCKEIKDKVNNGEAVKLGSAGTFVKDSSGQLTFNDTKLPAACYQPVEAIRVIHPDANHTMTVGDTETTTNEMEAYLLQDEPIKKDRWWIWAIVLAVVGLSIIALQYFQTNKFEISNQTIIETR